MKLKPRELVKLPMDIRENKKRKGELRIEPWENRVVHLEPTGWFIRSIAALNDSPGQLIQNF